MNRLRRNRQAAGMIDDHGRCMVMTVANNGSLIFDDLSGGLARGETSSLGSTRARFGRGRVPVGAALGFDEVEFHHLRLAKMPDEELQSAARWKIGKENNLHADRFNSGVCSVTETHPAGHAACEVLGVHVESERVERVRRSVERGGYMLQAIDTIPGAMTRSLSAPPVAPGAEEPLFLIVAIDTTGAWLFACADGETLCVHRLAVGRKTSPGHNSLEPRCDTLDRLDHAELVREYRAGLHFVLESGGRTGRHCIGTVLSLAEDSLGLLATLDGISGIGFVPLEEVVRPELRSFLDTLESESEQAAACVCYGMALHPDLGLQQNRRAA